MRGSDDVDSGAVLCEPVEGITCIYNEDKTNSNYMNGNSTNVVMTITSVDDDADDDDDGAVSSTCDGNGYIPGRNTFAEVMTDDICTRLLRIIRAEITTVKGQKSIFMCRYLAEDSAVGYDNMESNNGCCRQFASRTKLINHALTHTGERPYLCDYPGCTKSYARPDEIRRHQRQHTGEKPFKCTLCDMAFAENNSFLCHMKWHNKPRLECSFSDCSESFVKRCQLRAHEGTHIGKLPYACTVVGCTKSFTYPSKLKRHMENKHVVKKHECLKCPFTCSKWSEMVTHKRCDHPSVYPCIECGKEFRTEGQLKNHEITHDPNQPMFLCEHPGCGRSYTKAFALKKHVRVVHQRLRIFGCVEPECKRAFAHKRNLKLHIATHTELAHTDDNTGRRTVLQSLEEACQRVAKLTTFGAAALEDERWADALLDDDAESGEEESSTEDDLNDKLLDNSHEVPEEATSEESTAKRQRIK